MKTHKRTKVMAVDPGTRSGISWTVIRGNQWTQAEVVASWEAGTGGTCEVTGPTEAHRAWEILEFVRTFAPHVLVVEDFVIFPGAVVTLDRSGTEPMRINAMLQFWMWHASDRGPGAIGQRWPVELVWQMPGERLVITVDRLRELGLYRTKGKGGGKDSTSATQHLLAYVKKRHDALAKEMRKS